MTVTILQGFIALFGIVIAAFCAYGAFVPDKLSGSMKTAVQQSWAIYFAAGVRVVLGVILIAIADATRAPLVFEGFGWFVIVVAVLIPILGRTRFEGLMNWFLDKGAGVMRISMGFGIAFGLLIAYGAGVW